MPFTRVSWCVIISVKAEAFIPGTARTFTAEGWDTKKKNGRIITAVILGEAIWECDCVSHEQCGRAMAGGFVRAIIGAANLLYPTP